MLGKKKVEDIENAISDLIYEKYFIFFRGRRFYYCYLTSKQKDDDENNNILNAFKYAFSLGNNGQLFIWNQVVGVLMLYCVTEVNVDRTLFTDDEIAFIDKMINCAISLNIKREQDLDDLVTNINDPIIVNDKYLLVAPSKELNDLYQSFFKNNVIEFESYFLIDFEKNKNKFDWPGWFSLMYRPLMFAIIDRKSGNFIGTIGLSKDKERYPYNIEYFLFPQFRGKGIAFKCLTVFMKELFDGRLLINQETDYCGVYKKKHIRPLKIMGRVSIENIVSTNLLKKLGFAYSHTDKEFYEYQLKKVDNCVFYLTKSAFKKLFH